MWFALGAASSVLDGLQSLGSTKSGSGKSGTGGGLFGLNAGGSGSSGQVSPWSSSSSSPAVIPRCRAQTIGWFSRTASR